MADAIPLQRALVEEKPDVIIAMVGVNNLQGFKPEIPVQDLTAKFENFCDRMEEWMPPNAKIILSTVPPANDAKDPGPAQTIRTIDLGPPFGENPALGRVMPDPATQPVFLHSSTGLPRALARANRIARLALRL